MTDYQERNLLAVDTETDGLDWFAEHRPFVATTSDKSEDVWYDMSDHDQRTELRRVILDADGLVFHNAAFDIHMLVADGLFELDELLAMEIHDTSILARIVIPAAEANYQFGLKPLSKLLVDSSARDAEDELKQHMHALGLLRKGASNIQDGAYLAVFKEFPDVLTRYAMDDTRLTFELFGVLMERATPEDLMIYGLEQQVFPEIVRMEDRGIALDKDAVERLFTQYTAAQEDAYSRLLEFVTIPDFNPDSNDQVAETLMAAGVPLVDTTDSGQVRVDKWVLEKHADHPAVAALLDYRMFHKFLSTYVEGMRGRDVIHPGLWQLGTKTGRMSSSRPNMQNIPVRSGPEIRSVMVPREGNAFLVCDYSSIELRVLAHYMNSPEFWDIVLNGDPFLWLGENIYGTADQSSWPITRQSLKNGYYALTYGAGGPKLAATIGGGMTADEGRELARKIKGTLGTHFKVLNDRVQSQVRKHGFVRTIMKRTQYVPKDRAYTGLNYLIQGSAADVMKLGLLNVADVVREFDGHVLLPVHDELLAEVPAVYAEDALPRMQEAMTSATDLFPLAVSGAICESNYAQAK